MISKVIVSKLFGERDIELNLINGRGIFFGENGSGKTTFLNLVYMIMVGDPNFIDFNNYESVKIEFADGSEPLILQSEVIWPSEKPDEQNPNIFQHEIIFHQNYSEYLAYLESIKINYPEIEGIELEKLISELNDKNPNIFRSSSELINAFQKVNTIIRNELGNTTASNNFNNMVAHVNSIHNTKKMQLYESCKKIFNGIDHDVLYLNVYRNSPKIISKGGITEENVSYLEGNVVATNRKIEELKRLVISSASNVENLMNDAYRQMNSSLLSKLLDEKISITPVKKEDTEYIDRMFKYFSDFDPTKISRLKEIIVEPGDDKSYRILSDSMGPFIDKYKTDILPSEKKIDLFVEKVNGYLEYKKLVFNKEEFRFYIEINGEAKSVDTPILSSGEKHIYNIFASIIFNNKQNIHVLIDEPELSLSINWQKMFLKDISSFPNVKTMIVVTHSPYVVSEDLEECLMRFPSE